MGIVDAGYLSYEHFWGDVSQCRVIPVLSPLLGTWMDCGTVLSSKYSMVGPVPLAVLGLGFYVGVFGWAAIKLVLEKNSGVWKEGLGLLVGIAGVLASSYFVYLQLVILKAVCLYCMVSAVNSVLILVGMWRLGVRWEKGQGEN